MKVLRRVRISRSNKPLVVITMGDPSGVGPEVTLKALASPEVKGLANFLVIGDAGVLAGTARDTGCRMYPHILDMGNVPAKSFGYGEDRAPYGRASMQYIDMALELAASGETDAIVTAPVNKAAIKRSGIEDFRGHTEYIAGKFKVKKFAMMFAGPGLKVALVTRHVALKKVAASLSAKNIFDTIKLTHDCLKNSFGIKSPAIAVCGLNPHAGEGGAFGDEEAKIIAPAVKRASAFAKNVRGPLPADAVFYDAINERYDAVVAMYHDQGLAPFKMLYFDRGVNLTVGLPFVRTSPDHGTAFAIAGKGKADPRSMIEAIKLACRMQRCSPKTN
ncbi:MAG: 4-hydroxythreonine-4-phosphate dehydrogenase PdxA [Candidatus Omnitrophica bacterium]|nr:4-hydroxythreonine-4-phosphate dehydrogenase PdxA [Candidatus Omnitrophota bacterium]